MKGKAFLNSVAMQHDGSRVRPQSAICDVTIVYEGGTEVNAKVVVDTPRHRTTREVFAEVLSYFNGELEWVL
jgi:hypothetical protein